MNIDSLDLDIMKILQLDGRKTFREIAAILNKPESTVRLRYNQLVENKLLKVVAIPDLHVTGQSVMAIVCLKMDLTYLQEAAKTILKMDEVRFVACTSGKYDLILEVFMKSNEDLINFMTNSLSKIKGIKECDLSVELKLFKDSYDWLSNSD